VLGELYIAIHSIASEAERGELRGVSRLVSALDNLLKKLLEPRKPITSSALDTISATLMLIEKLCATQPRFEMDASLFRILVVDDEPIARRALSGALQLAFAKAQSADSGEAALALAEKVAFDVIFLDVLMPGMDGFATCCKIRETALNGGTPVVFVTSQTDMATRDQAILSGATGFIVKPVLPAEIGLAALTFAFRGRLEKTAIAHRTGEPGHGPDLCVLQNQMCAAGA